MKEDLIALFDMDGTLCDCEGVLVKDLNKLKSKYEPKIKEKDLYKHSDYLGKRSDLIKRDEEWWVNLPKLKLGWDILKIAKQLKFRIVILTQGPRTSKEAWSGKKVWIDKYLGKKADLIITRDKGIVYGRVLVDDYPEYIKLWLKNRPRGLVIMPAHEHNKHFIHPQVIRYTGKNIKQVKQALLKVKIRKEGEAIRFK